MPLQSRLNRQPVPVEEAAEAASQDVSPRQRRTAAPQPEPEPEAAPVEDHTDTHEGEENAETPSGDTQQTPAKQDQTPAAGVAARVGRGRKTAAKKAEGDPSIADRVMGMADEANKLLSAMRQNDSAKTMPDTYTTAELGYTRIL